MVVRREKVHVAQLLFRPRDHAVTKHCGVAQRDSRAGNVAHNPNVRKTCPSKRLEVTRQINIKHFNLKRIARGQLAVSEEFKMLLQIFLQRRELTRGRPARRATGISKRLRLNKGNGYGYG